MEDRQGVGALLVSDFLAEAYLIQSGMECPPVVDFLIAEITEPVAIKGKDIPPLLDSLFETEEGAKIVFDFFTEFVQNLIKMPKMPKSSNDISTESSNLTQNDASSTISDETKKEMKNTE